HAHGAVQGRHGAQGELPQPGHIGTQAPGVQQMRVRVDAHAQRTELLRGGHEAPAEGLRRAHARAATRSARAESWSCRARTLNGPRRMASMACTAAVNSCMVVMIARPVAVAAVRMS